VAEQELDLFQLTASQVAETGTRAPQIMWREVLDTGTLGRVLHYVPNRFWRNSFAPNLAEPVHPSEDAATVDTSSLNPPIDSSLRPHWHRHSADMLSLADEIGDNPVFLSNLEVIGSQTDELGTPESATNQQRQDGTVTLAVRRVQGQRLQQRSGLIDGQPIANFDSQSLRAFNTADFPRPVPGLEDHCPRLRTPVVVPPPSAR
jgi:hypothetical protein